MKNSYKATIVIPTYNNSELLNHTLNSITRQNITLEDIQVIVVDDGSTDDTKQITDSYSSILDLKYFYQEDRGNRVSLARNTGIENAESDIIVLIDTGILLASNCIIEHINQHRAHGPHCAIIGYVYGYDQYDSTLNSLINIIDVNSPTLTINKLREKGIYKDMREHYYEKYRYEINKLPAPWAFFLTCNVSINKSYLEKTGLFDQLFDQRWGVEDLDLGMRLHKEHVFFKVARNAESLHFPDRTEMADKFKEEIYNKTMFNQKHNCLSTAVFLETTFNELNDKLIEINNAKQSR